MAKNKSPYAKQTKQIISASQFIKMSNQNLISTLKYMSVEGRLIATAIVQPSVKLTT